MGKINNVIYKTCDEYSTKDAAKYYFYSNIMGLNGKIDNEFVNYYEDEIRAKNRVIGEQSKKYGVKALMSTSVMAISSVKNKSVVIVDT